jgi:hypothetical protein
MILMMGSKQRCFASLVKVSLEDLVPADQFYRQLERKLNLSFVRELVNETYAGMERPSIDPVIFFKLQLVLLFEGIRSDLDSLTPRFAVEAREAIQTHLATLFAHEDMEHEQQCSSRIKLRTQSCHFTSKRGYFG